MPNSEPKSFMELVVKRSIALEKLLEKNYGASGEGLGKKAISVESSLDPETFKRLKEIAHVRNSLLHEDINLREGREKGFLAMCDSVIQRLSSPPSRSGQRNGHTTESSSGNNNPKIIQGFAKPKPKEEPVKKAQPKPQPVPVKPTQNSYSNSSSRTSQNKKTIPASYSFSWVMPVLKISLALVAVVIVFNVGRFVFYQIGGFFSRFSSSSSTQTNSSPQYNANQTSYVKQIDCDQIFRKARKNKKVKIPSQCQDTSTSYQESQEKNRTVSFNKQENPQTRPENNEVQKHEADKQKAEQQKAEVENQQRLDAERREQAEQQQREQAAAMYRSMQENQRRDREQEQQQVEANRRNEEEAERKRAQARQDAAAREREKQRRTQENNERLIRMGTELRDKIFKRKN